MRGRRKTPIITVTAAKGGVGKSTTTACLATGLAKYHAKKVLVVEVDMQSSVCYQLGFGIKTDRHPKKGVVDFSRGEPFKSCVAPIYAPIQHDKTEPTGIVIIMAGDSRIKELEVELSQGVKGVNFSARLNRVADSGVFDAILIDTPPGFHRLTDEAWLCSDALILPVCPNDGEGRENLYNTYNQWKNVVSKAGVKPELLGVIQTMANLQTRVGKEASKSIYNAYSSVNLHLAVVRMDSKVAEASTVGQPLFEYAEYSRAAISYREAVQRCNIWIDGFANSYLKKRGKEEVATHSEAELRAEGG